MRECCISYYKYLIGDCKMPKTLIENVVFTFLMAVCMGAFMIGIVALATQMPLDKFLYVLTHVFPFMVLIGASLRLFVLNRPIGFILHRALLPHLKGFALSAGIVLLNVSAMATIMCALGTAVGCVISTSSLNGLSGFADAYLSILPVIYLSATLVSLFVAGPFVKMLFNKLDALYRLRYWRQEQDPENVIDNEKTPDQNKPITGLK